MSAELTAEETRGPGIGDGRPQSKTVRSVAAQKTHNLSIFRIYRSHSQRVICTV